MSAAELIVAAQALLGSVFAVSVVTKVAVPGFLDWLRTLTVVPERHLRAVAWSMAGVETVTLVLLALPGTRGLGLALAAAVIAFFGAAIAWLTRRGVSTPCRCFGRARRPMGAVEIARNALLTLVSAAAAVTAFVAPQPIPSWSRVALAILFGCASGAVVIRLDEIVQLFRPLLSRPSVFPPR